MNKRKEDWASHCNERLLQKSRKSCAFVDELFSDLACLGINSQPKAALENLDHTTTRIKVSVGDPRLNNISARLVLVVHLLVHSGDCCKSISEHTSRYLRRRTTTSLAPSPFPNIGTTIDTVTVPRARWCPILKLYNFMTRNSTTDLRANCIRTVRCAGCRIAVVLEMLLMGACYRLLRSRNVKIRLLTMRRLASRQ